MQNRSCIYCREWIETIYHIFFECKPFVLLRKDLTKTLRTLGMDKQKLTWNYIINMKDLKHKLEYDIISIYKQIVWNNLTKVR